MACERSWRRRWCGVDSLAVGLAAVGGEARARREMEKLDWIRSN